MTTDELPVTGTADTIETTVAVEPASEPASESAPASMEDTIRETYAKLTKPQRERGTDGKFVRAESTDTDITEAHGNTDEGADVPAIAAPASPEPKPWDAAPNTWKKDVAANYAALPESVRQEIHRREGDFHKGIEQYREAASFGQSLFEDLSPHFDAMRQIGGTPKEVVRDVMNAWRSLATGSPDQKRDTLLQLARGYGINLTEADAPRYREPQTAPELAPVLQRLSQLEGTITESQRAREAADHAERVAQAQKFLSDPSREYMDAVFDDVVALVRTGRDPAQAYEQAIWAHPETRAKLLAKQDEERKRTEAAQAAAARKAAAPNVTRRGTPPAASPRGTMEDTIRATYRQMQT